MPSGPWSNSPASGSRGTAPQLPREPRHTGVVWTLGLGPFGLAFSLTNDRGVPAAAARPVHELGFWMTALLVFAFFLAYYV